MTSIVLSVFFSLGHADVPAVSLDEAVSSARVHAAGVRVAEAQAAAASARLDQARDGRLPTLGVSGSVSVYPEPYEINFFGTGEAPTLDCTGTEQFTTLCNTFQGMLTGLSEPIPIHDQVTTSLTVRAVEPLTGQFAMADQQKAAELSEAASEGQRKTAVADAEVQVSDLWYQALQAEKQLEIADSQVRSLEQRVQTAQASFHAGNLTESDRLLAEVALAQAKQAVIQIAALRDTTYARLGGAMGNGGSPVRPAASAMSDAPPKVPPSADMLMQWALQSRPELAGARAQSDAAEKTADAASWARLPQINAIAAYTHLSGMGPFAETNSEFIGATLDWNFWSWGARTNQLEAIRAQATQAQAQVDAIETQARVDVQAKVLALQAAGSGYEVSKATIAQAEASLRAQEKRQAAGAGTMSDLLDAQSALVKAQSTEASALYDARRAEIALVRAVGRDPWGTGEQR